MYFFLDLVFLDKALVMPGSAFVMNEKKNVISYMMNFRHISHSKADCGKSSWLSESTLDRYEDPMLVSTGLFCALWYRPTYLFTCIRSVFFQNAGIHL